MTVKEVAQRTGLTNAAVYKRIKAKGVTLAAIKDAKTGHFTPDGERLIFELFNLDNAPEQAENRPEKPVDNQVEKLTTRVELLTSERDNLRATLEREQQLHAMTLTKLLPSGDPGEKGRFRAAWDVLRGRR